MNAILGSFQTNPMLGQAFPFPFYNKKSFISFLFLNKIKRKSEKKHFFRRKARRKRRRISSCLAEELEADIDIESAVPEFKALSKTRVDHGKALIFQWNKPHSLVPSRFNSRTRCEMIPNLFQNHHPSPITFHIPLQFHCLGQSPLERHSSFRGKWAGSGRSFTAGMGSGPTRSTPPLIRVFGLDSSLLNLENER